MSNFLKLVSRDTKTLTLGEDGELVVKSDISKGAFRSLLARMPADLSEDSAGFSALEADDFTTGLFETLVEGWNAVGPDGNPVEATVENYLQLPRDVATVVDTALMEHFNSLTVKETDKSDSTETGGGIRIV
jgi:hypothetical protein